MPDARGQQWTHRRKGKNPEPQISRAEMRLGNHGGLRRPFSAWSSCILSSLPFLPSSALLPSLFSLFSSLSSLSCLYLSGFLSPLQCLSLPPFLYFPPLACLLCPLLPSSCLSQPLLQAQALPGQYTFTHPTPQSLDESVGSFD